jgi:hypothetical protein
MADQIVLTFTRAAESEAPNRGSASECVQVKSVQVVKFLFSSVCE